MSKPSSNFRKSRGILGALVLLGGAVGCVQPFDGTVIQMTLFGVHSPGGEPQTTMDGASYNPGGRPPSGSHYELYAAYAAAGDRPEHLLNINISPVLDRGNPCFIELDEVKYPEYTGDEKPYGLHVTQWAKKLEELYRADGTVTDKEATALVTAQRRMGNLASLEGGLLAVVEHPWGAGVADTERVAFQDALTTLEAALPPVDAIDPASNAMRAQLCQEMFDRFPGWYVGADRMLVRPVNGNLLGMVDGQDPRTLAFLGGADFHLDTAIPAEGGVLRVNWQFDDPNDPRAAGYSESVGGLPPPTGYHYLAGDTEEVSRGYTRVRLRNQVYTSFTGEAAFVSHLADDNIHW